MSRPTKAPLTPLQHAVSLFMKAPLAEAVAMLETVNAIVCHRAEAEHYVPTPSIAEQPARPKPPRPRGRPPKVPAPPAVGDTPMAAVPPPPAVPPGVAPTDDGFADDPPPATPPGEPGSLTMAPLGDPPTPDTPLTVAAGGRAESL